MLFMGEMCLCCLMDVVSDGLCCDIEVLNAFNSCLNKFGFKVLVLFVD